MAWVSLQTLITALVTSGTTAIFVFAISPFYKSIRAYVWVLFRYQPLYDALEQLREVKDQVEEMAATNTDKRTWLHKAAELREKGQLLISHKIRSAKSWRRVSSSNHVDEENDGLDIEAPPVREELTISFEQPLPQQCSGSSNNQNDGQNEIYLVQALPNRSSNNNQNADQNEDQLFKQNFGNGWLRFSFLRKVNRAIAYGKLLLAVH